MRLFIKLFSKGVTNINKTSLNIIQIGTQLACGVAIIGAIYSQRSVALLGQLTGIGIVQIAISIFAESMIMGLIIDCYAQRIK